MFEAVALLGLFIYLLNIKIVHEVRN